MRRLFKGVVGGVVLGLAAAAGAVDSKDNAALRYWRAWSLISEAEDTTLSESYWGYESPEEFQTTPELVRFIEDQQDVIKLLREASSMPACDFGVDYEKGPHALMTHLGPMRKSVHLLTLDARLHANTGDTERAVDDLAAALRMCRHSSEGSLVIGSLVTAAMFEATRQTVNYMLDAELLDESAKQELLEVLATFNRDDPFGIRAGVEGERLAMVDWLGRHVVPEDSQGRLELAAMTDEVLGELSPEEREQVEMLKSIKDLSGELEMFDLYYKHVLGAWESKDGTKKIQTISEHAARGGYGHFAGLLAPALAKVHENWLKSVGTFADLRERLSS